MLVLAAELLPLLSHDACHPLRRGLRGPAPAAVGRNRWRRSGTSPAVPRLCRPRADPLLRQIPPASRRLRWRYRCSAAHACLDPTRSDPSAPSVILHCRPYRSPPGDPQPTCPRGRCRAGRGWRPARAAEVLAARGSSRRGAEALLVFARVDSAAASCNSAPGCYWRERAVAAPGPHRYYADPLPSSRIVTVASWLSRSDALAAGPGVQIAAHVAPRPCGRCGPQASPPRLERAPDAGRCCPPESPPSPQARAIRSPTRPRPPTWPRRTCSRWTARRSTSLPAPADYDPPLGREWCCCAALGDRPTRLPRAFQVLIGTWLADTFYAATARRDRLPDRGSVELCGPRRRSTSPTSSAWWTAASTNWHRVVPNFVVQDGDGRDGWAGGTSATKPTACATTCRSWALRCRDLIRFGTVVHQPGPPAPSRWCLYCLHVELTGERCGSDRPRDLEQRAIFPVTRPRTV